MSAAYLGFKDQRLQRFTTLSPVMPTTAKVVMGARALDGLSFTVQEPVLVERLASVAHRKDEQGRLHVVGTDPTVLAGRYRPNSPAPPQLSTLWSTSPQTGERTALHLAPCINPAGVKTKSPIQCVDPVMTQLPSGESRLFFVRMAGRADPAFAGEPNLFYSATRMGDDSWTLDPGIRMSVVGAADPDVVRTHDGRFRMYFTRGTPDAQGVVTGPGIFSAVSDDDAVSFSVEAGQRIPSCSASATLALETGGYRLYCHRRDLFMGDSQADPRAYIVSYRSDDGVAFVAEEGVRIGPELGVSGRTIGAAAPSISVDADGAVQMLFTTVKEPHFPANWLYLRDNERHFNRVAGASRDRQQRRSGERPTGTD